MDVEIKKDLTSNWFKTLQNTICNSINDLEKNKRSLNIASSVAIILAESLKQTNLI